MDYLNHLPDAIDMVATWNLPEDDLIEAIHQQASLMADITHFYRPPTSTPLQLPLDLH